MAKRVPKANPEVVAPTFAHIPVIIRESGRVAGFEALRDYALEHWDTLKGQINPYSALKFALEADRHALFAEVAELRKQGNQAAELSGELSEYLQGRVDVAPDATGERATIPSSRGYENFPDLDELITETPEDGDDDEDG